MAFLKIPRGMIETLVGKIDGTFSPVSLALLLDVSTGYCQRALVHESGMIRTQMGTYKRSEMVTVHETPCAIPPLKLITVNVLISTFL
jgi:hypothetical protein